MVSTRSASKRKAGSLPPVTTLEVSPSLCSNSDYGRSTSPQPVEQHIVTVDSFLRHSTATAAPGRVVTYRKRKKPPTEPENSQSSDEVDQPPPSTRKRKRHRPIKSMRPQGSFYPREEEKDKVTSNDNQFRMERAPPPLSLFLVLENSQHGSQSSSPRRRDASQNSIDGAMFLGKRMVSPTPEDHLRQKPASSWRHKFEKSSGVQGNIHSPKTPTPRKKGSPQKYVIAMPLQFVSLEEHQASYSKIRDSQHGYVVM